MSTFLQHLLSRDLRPGSAVGDRTWPAWVFLLPDLTPGSVCVVGAVPPPVLDGLVALGGAMRSTGTEHADLIVAGPGADAASLTDVVRRSPGAAVVVLPGAVRPSGGTQVVRLGPGDAGPITTPDPGRRTGVAVPIGPTRPSVPARVAARTLRVAGRDVAQDVGASVRWAPRAGSAQRSDVVVLHPDGDRGPGPPQYLRALGLTDPDWSVVGLAEGPTHRAVFLPGASGDRVVKVALGPTATAGLAREAQVLHALRAYPAVVGSVPELLGHSGGTSAATLVQTALPGGTFRERGTGTPVGPLLGAGLDALHRLASATSRREPDALQAPLEALVGVFAAGFGDGPVVDRLRLDVDNCVRAAPPVVALHGDPRPENLLVHDGARIGFVNWEHGESAGPPTWDLFHLLLEDVEMWLGRRGRSATPRVLARQLFGRGDWHHRLHRELARASGELGFTTHANGPLVRLGIAALACRELPTVQRDAPREAHRYRLLAEVVARVEGSAEHLVP